MPKPFFFSFKKHLVNIQDLKIKLDFGNMIKLTKLALKGPVVLT